MNSRCSEQGEVKPLDQSDTGRYYTCVTVSVGLETHGEIMKSPNRCNLFQGSLNDV